MVYLNRNIYYNSNDGIGSSSTSGLICGDQHAIRLGSCAHSDQHSGEQKR